MLLVDGSMQIDILLRRIGHRLRIAMLQAAVRGMHPACKSTEQANKRNQTSQKQKQRDAMSALVCAFAV